MSESFQYQPLVTLQGDDTEYRLLTKEFVECGEFEGQEVLKVDPKALTLLAKEAFSDVAFFYRASHLKSVAKVLEDPSATENDRYVAETMLKNAVVAAEGKLPMCQDTGTAIVVGKKGERVLTGGKDPEALSLGIYETYQEKNLRYSQIAPLSMFEEKNTKTNLPAQIDLYSEDGAEYHFLFVAKGGGSANKTYLFQETKSLLNEKNLTAFVKERIKLLGTSACPPYHIALVIGGTSAEMNSKMVKLASCKYLDAMPTEGNGLGQGFRDLEWEERIHQIAEETGVGAQFGGKYYAHDVRVIRFPRHAASCPVGLGVSCSADRNIKGKITKEGIFLEKLEKDPKRYLQKGPVQLSPPVSIDLEQPMEQILKTLSQYPIKTRLLLTGTLIVARDAAHARIQAMLHEGQPMPEYFKNHPIYYAGPAKKPEGMPSGSFGPTTASRMDPYVAPFMKEGGSMIMLAKGNRSKEVAKACQTYGGFYLGSIGGPAAILAQESILAVEVIDFPEMGMEAVHRIKVKDFPAFIICDDKGHDFFSDLT